MQAVVHHGRQLAGYLTQDIFFDDYQVDPGCPDIFLCAGIDKVMPVKIDYPAENIAAHVRYQRNIRIRKRMHLGSFDGIVGSTMKIFGAGRKGEVLWNIRIVLVFGSRYHVYIAEEPGFFDRLGAPYATV